MGATFSSPVHRWQSHEDSWHTRQHDCEIHAHHDRPSVQARPPEVEDRQGLWGSGGSPGLTGFSPAGAWQKGQGTWPL